MEDVEIKNNATNKYMFISVMFVSLMIISNLLACKVMSIGNWVLTPAVFIYPFSFMFGDVLTELYGFKNARKVILTGFLVQILLTVFSYLAILMPYPSFWEGQEAFKTIFGTTPQIIAGSLLAYLVGELVNSTIMVKVKKWTNGKFLWLRTISSTIFGEFFDTIIFISIAFWGRVPLDAMIQMIILQLTIKVLTEAIFGTPLAYMLIKGFKSKE